MIRWAGRFLDAQCSSKSKSDKLTLFAVTGVASFFGRLHALVINEVPVKVVLHQILWVALVLKRHELLPSACALRGFSLPLRLWKPASLCLILVQSHACRLFLPFGRLLDCTFLLIFLALPFRKLLDFRFV